MTVALSALVGCFSEPEPDASPSAPDSPAPAPVVTESFPITRSLVDNKDRTIKAHLIGRSDSHVRFYRLGTSTREIFTYPIKNLSVEDQVFLARLPTTFSQPLDTTEAPTTAESAREVRLRNLDLEIARQEERIEEVQQRLHPDMPNSQRKAVKNEIIRKVAELKKLEERKKEILAQP
tara:strand:- start:32000 stop:32533 length:534 start_codon:yes stop_codon:yes gene_type:complete